MIIRKLRASFGKLEGESLRFHDGLNVIYAPNESGKSTWCAFIRAMLYGIDSSERAREGYLPDKQRYAPWSGAPMEGSMDVRAEGTDITLQRRTTVRSAPMRDFSAVYTGTNTPVEGMTGQNCGELLTGVSKEVFRRSAFIAQGGVAVSGSPELEKRIQQIVSSGDEQTSYSEAENRLRTWQHRRRYHRKGLLPVLEGEMDEAQRLLSDIGTSADSVREMEGQLQQLQLRCNDLEQSVAEARKRQRNDALQKLRDGRADVQRRNDDHDAALAELSRRREALQRSEFGDRSREELEAEVSSDMDSLEEIREDTGHRFALFPAVAFSILAILLAALYGLWTKLPYILGAGFMCVGAIIFFLRYSRIRQAAQRAFAEQERILRKYKVSIPEDVPGVYTNFCALEDAVLEGAAEEQHSRDRYDHAVEELHRLEDAAVNELDFAGGDTEAARLSRMLHTARQEASALAAKISGLNGRLSAMGDPMVVASSLRDKQTQYQMIQSEYDAITLAQELLREADQEIQSRFSPALSSLAAKYMNEMTGGRYEDVLVGQDFSARTRVQGDTVARDAEFLSAGTADLMYLAVRLAVCELALPDGEPCPLILDDALVNLDETREAQAMNLLKRIALKRQVILFTCRKPAGFEKE
ncbi:MAG: AAA family ATPase [Oscillospiraceae bacterium]|nr:AAA family ATPase [Oscillospiraceae bacterium]MBQ6428593.1 AAA family ATPase [Oscillospiraceae bacterium]